MILKNTDKINVRIFMKTLQDSERLENSYEGTFQIKNGKKYLVYNDGYEPCSLVCDAKVVRLTRFKSKTTMIFEENTEHICPYVTPMGSMSLSVKTDRITDKLLQENMLLIEYNLSVENTEPVKNKISIMIEEI